MLVDATEFFLRDAHGVAAVCARRSRATTRRRHAERALPAADEGVPEEHRSRGDADLRHDRPPGPSSPGDADAENRHRARAPFARRVAARRRITPRRLDPRVGFIRHRRSTTTPRRSRRRSRSAGFSAIVSRRRTPAAAFRARQADRLLRRQRRAGADPQRARRRRIVVEPRRSRRRVSRTASRSRCCRPMPTRWTSATT